MADGTIRHSKPKPDCFDKFLFKIGLKWKQYLEEDIFKRGPIKDKFFEIRGKELCTIYLYIPDCYLDKSKTKSNTHIHLFYETHKDNIYLGYSFKFSDKHPIEQNQRWKLWSGDEFKLNHTNDELIRNIINELIVNWARFITFPCEGKKTIGKGRGKCYDISLIRIGNIWRDFTRLLPEMPESFYSVFLDYDYRRRVIEVSEIKDKEYDDGYYMVSTYEKSRDCHLYLYLPYCYSNNKDRNRLNTHIHVYYKNFKGYPQTWIGINIKIDDKGYTNDPMFYELKGDFPDDEEIKEVGMAIIAKFQEFIGFPCQK